MTSSNPTDAADSPLRDVARNPAAFARYLADLRRMLLEVHHNLERLREETRVHCLQENHVKGDRRYDAQLRTWPVERALKGTLKHLNQLTSDLEKSAYKRNAFTDKVNKLPQKRHEKALKQQQRKGRTPLTAVPDSPSQEGGQGQNQRYSEPTSLYDLRDEESA